MDPLGEPAQVRILLAPLFWVAGFRHYFLPQGQPDGSNPTLSTETVINTIEYSNHNLTCQSFVQKIFQLDKNFDIRPGRSKSSCNLLGLVQLLVQLVPQSLDGLPIIDVHLILNVTTNIGKKGRVSLLPTECRHQYCNYSTHSQPHKERHQTITVTLTLISLQIVNRSSIALSLADFTTRRSSSDSDSDEPSKNLLAPPFLSSSDSSDSDSDPLSEDSSELEVSSSSEELSDSSSEVTSSSLSSSLSLPRPQNLDACTY